MSNQRVLLTSKKSSFTICKLEWWWGAEEKCGDEGLAPLGGPPAPAPDGHGPGGPPAPLPAPPPKGGGELTGVDGFEL